jgi:hypothetical protein
MVIAIQQHRNSSVARAGLGLARRYFGAVDAPPNPA